MRNVAGFFVVLISILALTGVASPAQAVAVNAQDRTYLTANAQTNLAEVATAKIALQRSASSSVRELASMITTDHEKAQADLKKIARTAGVTLPAVPSAQQVTQAKRLAVIGGDSFDTSYLLAQARGHLTSIENTEREIISGSDPDVIAYAARYLPVAEKHLTMVDEAIVAEHAHGPLPTTSRTPIAPTTTTGRSPAAEVGTGTHAVASTSKPSDDAPWLIAVAVVIVVLIGAGLLWLRRSAQRH
jgi:putative membrane protein